MVRQHVKLHLLNAEEGASASSPNDDMQTHDVTDQDVAAILGLSDHAFDDIRPYAVLVKAPRQSCALTPFKLSAACALIFAALIGLRWGVPLMWHHSRGEDHPEFQTAMMAAVALSGNTAPSPSPPSADKVITERPKNLDGLESQSRLSLARVGPTRLDIGGFREEPRPTRASADRTSFDVASASSPRQNSDQHRPTLDRASEVHGFMDAKADPDRLARAERLEAVDAIRLLRQK